MRRNAVVFVAAAGAGCVVAARGDAATVQMGGFVDVHAGYGANPFFRLQSEGASPSLGVTASATLTRLTAVSRSELTGVADLNQYLNHYGRAENYTATLAHNQQLSQKLAVAGNVSYTDSINPGPSFSTASADLLPLGDLLTVGQRIRRVSGSADLTYEPDERNLFQAGVNGSHARFAGGIANSYDTYGVNVGYLRTFSPRTKVGIQLGASRVNSSNNPNGRSNTIGLQLVQRLGPVWRFEGGASLLLQRQAGQSFKTPAFNASLCGTYPRLEICLLASRLSAASGLGGLRVDTQAGARINYKLTPRSTIDGSGTYNVSSSNDNGLPKQTYYDAALAYRRVLTPRVSLGVSGRLQGRDFGRLPQGFGGSSTSYSATVNFVWKFGRIGRS